MIATDVSDVLFGEPQPLAVAGQPGRAPQGRSEHRRPRPRADALRRDRGRRPRSGAAGRGRGQGRQRHQPGRHLLHGQRDPHAARHSHRRQFPPAGAGDPDRGGGRDAGGRAVRLPGAGRIAEVLPYQGRLHQPQGQVPQYACTSSSTKTTRWRRPSRSSAWRSRITPTAIRPRCGSPRLRKGWSPASPRRWCSRSSAASIGRVSAR